MRHVLFADWPSGSTEGTFRVKLIQWLPTQRRLNFHPRQQDRRFLTSWLRPSQIKALHTHGPNHWSGTACLHCWSQKNQSLPNLFPSDRDCFHSTDGCTHPVHRTLNFIDLESRFAVAGESLGLHVHWNLEPIHLRAESTSWFELGISSKRHCDLIAFASICSTHLYSRRRPRVRAPWCQHSSIQCSTIRVSESWRILARMSPSSPWQWCRMLPALVAEASRFLSSAFWRSSLATGGMLLKNFQQIFLPAEKNAELLFLVLNKVYGGSCRCLQCQEIGKEIRIWPKASSTPNAKLQHADKTPIGTKSITFNIAADFAWNSPILRPVWIGMESFESGHRAKADLIYSPYSICTSTLLWLPPRPHTGIWPNRHHNFSKWFFMVSTNSWLTSVWSNPIQLTFMDKHYNIALVRSVDKQDLFLDSGYGSWIKATLPPSRPRTRNDSGWGIK